LIVISIRVIKVTELADQNRRNTNAWRWDILATDGRIEFSVVPGTKPWSGRELYLPVVPRHNQLNNRGGDHMFLNDQETEVDLLYHEAIAKTIVRLIRRTPETPVTVGVHGDWGAGKSSVLKMTAAALEKDDKALCLWFNGWTFEGFADAKTVVIETIVEELRRKRPTSAKVREAAAKVLKRVEWLKVAKKTVGFTFTALTGVPTFDQAQALFAEAKAFLARPQDSVTPAEMKEFIDQAGDFVKGAEADNVPQQMHKFREEFSQLIRAAEIEQLVVIVDDLDRCLPETAIATLEAIRLFLFVPNTAFVIGADELMIEYAVREHFPDLPVGMGSVPYARNYLEKLIQVPFRLPALGLTETRIYITLLQVEAALGPDHASFKKLLAGARTELKRPWMSQGLDSIAVARLLAGETIPDEVRRAVEISGQISRVLTEGTRGNPRQIKRFLNSMALRFAIAQERGFQSEIALPALAKIMLAESFSHEFYAQIARLAVAGADGKVKALAQLEAAGQKTAQDEAPKAARSNAAALSDNAAAPPEPPEPEVAEWLTSEWTKGWAAISPALAEVDLRPYVFATRDKRSYLGGLAAPGHLESLVDRLMGPRWSVRQLAGEVSKLSGAEPEQTFEALSSSVMMTEDLSREPKGLHGLVLLVEYHPGLQRRLAAFLGELPVIKLGTWATSNFSGVFKDSAVSAQFKEVVRRWSIQTENPTLKAAAAGILTLTRT
jgi:hypothetical protein